MLLIVVIFSAYGSCRPPHFSILKSEIWVLRFEVSTFKCEAGNSESWYRERSGRICKSRFYRMFKIQMGLMRFGNQWSISFFTFLKNPNGPDKIKRVWKLVFYQTFKIQMDTMRFGRFWKNNFLWFFKNPNGPDKVWKGLKTTFLQNIQNPKGPNEIWKVLKNSFLRFLKIQMGLTRFERVWKPVFYKIL